MKLLFQFQLANLIENRTLLVLVYHNKWVDFAEKKT